MNGPAPPGAAGQHADSQALDRLRHTSNELEALFLSQLFRAMQDTVVKTSLTEPSQGEDLFRSLLTDHLASHTAVRSTGGIGEKLFEQLQTAFLRDSESQTKGSS